LIIVYFICQVIKSFVQQFPKKKISKYSGDTDGSVLTCYYILDHHAYAMQKYCIEFFFSTPSVFMLSYIFFMQVNSSPYKDGWIIKVELSDNSELNYCSSFLFYFALYFCWLCGFNWWELKLECLGIVGQCKKFSFSWGVWIAQVSFSFVA